MDGTPTPDPATASNTAALITAIGSLLGGIVWPALILGLIAVLSWSARTRDRLARGVKNLGALLQPGTKLMVGPVSIEVPAGIATDTVKSATKEGVSGGSLAEIPAQLIESMQHEGKSDQPSTYPYLLHSAVMQVPRTTPKSGRYSVRIWVEFDKGFGFGAECVNHVVYRLNESWASDRRVISTAAAESQFELWLSVYGEFTIVAAIEKADGTVVWLSRYLDLPGRPPD